MSLDQSVARDCADACAALIQSLHAAREALRNTNFNINLGDFSSGKQLSEGLYKAIRGDDDSLYARLGEHIEVVKLIHDTVGAQVAEMLVTDADVAAGLKKSGV